MFSQEEWGQKSDATRRRLLLDALEGVGRAAEVKGFLERGPYAGAACLVVVDGDEFIAVPPEPEAVLGCQRSLSMLPPEMVEGYGMAGYDEADVQELLLSYTGPRRTVSMPWLLVERVARVAWHIGRDDLPIRSCRFKVQKKGRVHYLGPEDSAPSVFEPWISPASAQSYIGQPWRLPTSDEWEYFCRAQQQGLFWWGDAWPPFEASPEDPMGFSLHRQPNSLGLVLPGNAFDWEFTSSGVMCGGDGGFGACNGDGPLGYWLPLSPSFRYSLEAFPDGVSDGRIRRVRTLDLGGSNPG